MEIEFNKDMSKDDPQKGKMTKEEIATIIKRNVALFKNDPDFANYIVDLTLYLVEYHYLDEEIKKKRDKDKSMVGSKVYRLFPDSRRDDQKYCIVCGAPTGGMMRCPNCGHLAG